MNTERFIVRDREAGNYIDGFNTLDEAIQYIKEYEKEDALEDMYKDDFYEVYDSELEEIVY